MPQIRVIFYQEDEGDVPVLDWIMKLIPKAQAKCLARIKRLQQRGHELRRPEADYLRDDIHELRVGHQRVNYRILYFFHGRIAAVLAHGIVKEGRVPPIEVDRAIARKRKFERNPKQHTYQGETERYGN